jgi:hypothetical protein|nr:MAG TPA: protein of unknown function UPF0542 [Caudoviricetes sp.]
MASLFTFLTVLFLMIIIPMFIIIGYVSYRLGYKKGLLDQDKVNYERYKKFYYENYNS